MMGAIFNSVMTRFFFLIAGFWMLLGNLSAQADEAAIEAKYQELIQLEYINDVYIPVDIPDAMDQLNMLSNEQGRAKLLEADEELAAERLVLSLGKWMILHWNFFEGSRLSHRLRDYGLSHPDDMARFLIVTYHRYLREVPLELEKRGAIYFDQRKAEQEARNRDRKILSNGNN